MKQANTLTACVFWSRVFKLNSCEYFAPPCNLVFVQIEGISYLISLSEKKALELNFILEENSWAIYFMLNYYKIYPIWPGSFKWHNSKNHWHFLMLNQFVKWKNIKLNCSTAMRENIQNYPPKNNEQEISGDS